MGVSSPMPSSLPKECAKATQIFNSFASIIPQEILRGAKGFAILTIAKAGFLFSARAGTGLVIVKLPDGSWSAPSAVGTGGVGVGGQAGAELSEFVIILNSRAAVQSFMSNGSINLGGNLSVAVGPIGRNAEASGSINKFATMYSYSRTRGLFGGASLEGSVIMERNDANTKAYRQYLDDYYPGEVNARMLLSGNMTPPPWAQGLIGAIERRVGTHLDSTWVDDEPSDHEERRNRGYSFGSEYARQSSANSPRRGDNNYDYDDRQGDDAPVGNSSKERMSYMANQYKGRLRGNSLGSFGRSKSNSGSGTSTPTKKGARDRSFSTATPRTRYDEDGEEYVDDDYSDYRTQRGPRRQTSGGGGGGGGFDDEDHEGQTTGRPRDPGLSASKSSKFTDFMKRPVLPTRKSTSAVQSARSSSGKDSPTSRWRPGSSIAKRDKNRLQYGGKYDSDEDRYGRRRATGDIDDDDAFGGGSSRRTGGPDSPFGDHFTQVEHRFSSEVEEDERESFRGSTNSRSGNGASSGTKSRMMQSMSRPLNKRSATAPLSRTGRSTFDDGDGDGLEEIITRTNQVNLSFGTKFDENTARQSFDSYDTAGRRSDIISLGDGSNPFDEDHAATSTVVRNSASHTHSGRNADRHHDLLSTLDEDLPSSSSFSDVEKPLHRLESRKATGYGGHPDRDDSSIRSFDSSKEYMVVGQKAHRIPLHVQQVDNDLSQPLSRSQYGSAANNVQKEWRIATFDFEGGQAGDLSFKVGEIIEITDKQDPDWYTGRIGSREGIVPVNRTRPHQG